MKTILEKIQAVKDSSGEILELNDMELSEIPSEVFDLYELKVLRLRRNKIKHVPKELAQLQSLIELNLIENELDEFPKSVLELKNLEVLHLRKNNISEIPNEIGQLKKLLQLNLGNNNLTELPEGIGGLTSVANIFLKKNNISRLPSAIKFLKNLKELNYVENPVVYPPEDILRGGLMRIILFFILEENDAYNKRSFSFKIPKELRTAIKQYLSYFPDYVEISKGRNLAFETKTSEDGVRIEMSLDADFDEVSTYFNEYLGFIKSNIDSLDPQIETNITAPKKQLLILELKQQVTHLKQQVEFKNFQIQFLENQVDNYYNLLNIEKSNPATIAINALTQSTSTSNSSSELNSEISINLKIEIPKLQSELLEAKANLPNDAPESLKKEIEDIDHELMEQREIADKSDVNQVPLRKIKRLFDNLSNEDSEWNKTLSKSKKLKESLQNLGKTYNKIAQWTGLPNIPDLLLNL